MRFIVVSAEPAQSFFKRVRASLLEVVPELVPAFAPVVGPLVPSLLVYASLLFSAVVAL
ncbi:MAG TPA: hypothetical protein VF266_21610 [Thermoanaerobaculia bacterium]